MVGTIFIALLLAFLSAFSLAFSGWPCWVAIAAYIICGMLGLVLAVALVSLRSLIMRGSQLVASTITARNSRWRRREKDYLQPRSIPALSDSNSRRNSG